MAISGAEVRVGTQERGAGASSRGGVETRQRQAGYRDRLRQGLADLDAGIRDFTRFLAGSESRLGLAFAFAEGPSDFDFRRDEEQNPLRRGLMFSSPQDPSQADTMPGTPRPGGAPPAPAADKLETYPLASWKAQAERLIQAKYDSTLRISSIIKGLGLSGISVIGADVLAHPLMEKLFANFIGISDALSIALGLGVGGLVLLGYGGKKVYDIYRAGKILREETPRFREAGRDLLVRDQNLESGMREIAREFSPRRGLIDRTIGRTVNGEQLLDWSFVHDAGVAREAAWEAAAREAAAWKAAPPPQALPSAPPSPVVTPKVTSPATPPPTFPEAPVRPAAPPTGRLSLQAAMAAFTAQAGGGETELQPVAQQQGAPAGTPPPPGPPPKSAPAQIEAEPRSAAPQSSHSRSIPWAPPPPRRGSLETPLPALPGEEGFDLFQDTQHVPHSASETRGSLPPPPTLPPMKGPEPVGSVDASDAPTQGKTSVQLVPPGAKPPDASDAPTRVDQTVPGRPVPPALDVTHTQVSAPPLGLLKRRKPTSGAGGKTGNDATGNGANFAARDTKLAQLFDAKDAERRAFLAQGDDHLGEPVGLLGQLQRELGAIRQYEEARDSGALAQLTAEEQGEYAASYAEAQKNVPLLREQITTLTQEIREANDRGVNQLRGTLLSFVDTLSAPDVTDAALLPMVTEISDTLEALPPAVTFKVPTETGEEVANSALANDAVQTINRVGSAALAIAKKRADDAQDVPAAIATIVGSCQTALTAIGKPAESQSLGTRLAAHKATALANKPEIKDAKTKLAELARQINNLRAAPIPQIAGGEGPLTEALIARNDAVARLEQLAAAEEFIDSRTTLLAQGAITENEHPAAVAAARALQANANDIRSAQYQAARAANERAARTIINEINAFAATAEAAPLTSEAATVLASRMRLLWSRPADRKDAQPTRTGIIDFDLSTTERLFEHAFVPQDAATAIDNLATRLTDPSRLSQPTSYAYVVDVVGPTLRAAAEILGDAGQIAERVKVQTALGRAENYFTTTLPTRLGNLTAAEIQNTGSGTRTIATNLAGLNRQVVALANAMRNERNPLTLRGRDRREPFIGVLRALSQCPRDVLTANRQVVLGLTGNALSAIGLVGNQAASEDPRWFATLMGDEALARAVAANRTYRDIVREVITNAEIQRKAGWREPATLATTFDEAVAKFPETVQLDEIADSKYQRRVDISVPTDGSSPTRFGYINLPDVDFTPFRTGLPNWEQAGQLRTRAETLGTQLSTMQMALKALEERAGLNDARLRGVTDLITAREKLRDDNIADLEKARNITRTYLRDAAAAITKAEMEKGKIPTVTKAPTEDMLTFLGRQKKRAQDLEAIDTRLESKVRELQTTCEEQLRALITIAAKLDIDRIKKMASADADANPYFGELIGTERTEADTAINKTRQTAWDATPGTTAPSRTLADHKSELEKERDKLAADKAGVTKDQQLATAQKAATEQQAREILAKVEPLREVAAAPAR